MFNAWPQDLFPQHLFNHFLWQQCNWNDFLINNLSEIYFHGNINVFAENQTWQRFKLVLNSDTKRPEWKMAGPRPTNAGTAHIWDPNLLNTAHANALAPIGARPSADTVLTTQLHIISLKVYLTINDFEYILANQMI